MNENYKKAKNLAVDCGYLSIPLLMNKLRISHLMAEDIIERFSTLGIIDVDEDGFGHGKHGLITKERCSRYE